MLQCGVEAAPSATMGRLEAEVDGGRYGVGGEEGVGEFEEGVGPTVEALVERVAEGAKGVKSVVRFHDALIMHSLTAYRILQPPTGLKRKLRACANRRVAYVSSVSGEAVQSLWALSSTKRCQPIGAASNPIPSKENDAL